MSSQLQIVLNLQDNVSNQLKGITGKIEGMQPQFKSMAKIGTAGFTAITGAVAGSVYKTAEWGDTVMKTSKQMGIGAESFQELDYWATQNGMSTEDLERMVGRLNTRMGEALEGSDKYKEGFEDLSVELKDGEGNIRATEDVLQDSIQALRDIEDPQLRAAKGAEIFGQRTIRRMMPALEDGSLSIEEATEKIHEMGGVMEDDVAEQGEEFMDMLDNLQRTLGTVGREFGKVFMPILIDLAEKIQPVIQRMSEWIEENPELTKWITIIAGALFGLVAVIGTLGMIVGPVIAGFKAIGAVMAVVMSPILLKIAAIVALIAIIWYLWNNWETVVEYLKKAWEAWATLFKGIGNAIKDFFVAYWNFMENLFFSAVQWIYDVTIGRMLKAFAMIKQGAQNFWNWIKYFWGQMAGLFKRATDWIYDNTIGRLIEGFERLRDVASDVLGRVGDIGGDILGSIGGLIGLQEGGIVTSPRVARIGEHGPEAVIPLNGKNGIGGGTTINVYVQGGNYLDRDAGEMFGEYLSEEIRRNIRQYLG